MRRRVLPALGLLVLVGIWLVLSTIIVRAAWTSLQHPERVPVTASAPSRQQLDAAISLSEPFIEGLYAQRDNGRMAMSEYYGLPVRARFAGGKWQLLGDAQNRIKRVYSGTYGDVGLATWKDGDDEVTGRLIVNWYQSKSFARIVFTPLIVKGAGAQLSLNEHPLMRVGPQDVGHRLDVLVPLQDRRLFRSHRFTVRHATNDAEQYARYRRQPDVARRMGATSRQTGFPAGRDIYAAMWGASARWEDAMPFTTSVYADCSRPLAADSVSYGYISKTCAVPDRSYVWLSSFDPLVRMLQGMHVLARHSDPDRRYRDREHTRVSVRGELGRWEQMYRRQGGMPRCSPIACDTTWNSGIRTAVFGALQTEMGYRHGDPVSRTYADQVARVILASQITDSGILRTAYGAYYRPLMVGGFSIAWRKGMLMGFSPRIPAKGQDEITGALSMPKEYVGYVASNGESAMAAYAFLVRYRCLKYNVGCSAQFPAAHEQAGR